MDVFLTTERNYLTVWECYSPCSGPAGDLLAPV